MSYNPNFYSFHGNDATFQNYFHPHSIPPPPIPPPFFITPAPLTEMSDQEFVKSFDQNIQNQPTRKGNKCVSISEVRRQLQSIIATLNDLKAKDKLLTENMSTFSDEEWTLHMKQIEGNKAYIDTTLAHIKGSCLDVLHKLLAKRVAKRLRMKRVRLEIKREKEEKRKELKERSRKIDENLQRIKDDIMRAQQEEEAKRDADVVLKEVLRKKNDAKKCIVKLDALEKLRKARQNTAKGRGESISATETSTFNTCIEKLKVQWIHKLSAYEAEESQLRAKLKEDSVQMDVCTNVTEREVANNLAKWKEVLFGGQLPQVDFMGDLTRFVAVRSQWDQYINSEGNPLPIGWVTPSKTGT